MTLSTDFKELENKALATLFQTDIQNISTETTSVNDFQFYKDYKLIYGEYKTRVAEYDTYEDWILEHRKLSNLTTKLATLLGLEIGKHTEFPTITTLLHYCRKNGVKFYYVNYFSKSNSVAVWDLVDVLLGGKYELGSVYCAKTTASDFKGNNVNINKTVYKLKLADAQSHTFNFLPENK